MRREGNRPSADVADALEALALLGTGKPSTPPARPAAQRALVEARTCYRHLAGRLGVAWLGALERAKLIGVGEGAIALTGKGQRWLASVGPAPASWPVGKPCLDWTERRYHLGGPLGVLLTDRLFAMKWIARRGDGRGVRTTAKGEAALAEHFSLRLPAS